MMVSLGKRAVQKFRIPIRSYEDVQQLGQALKFVVPNSYKEL